MAEEVGGDQAGNLTLYLGGDGGKEGWLGRLGQQVGLSAQGLQQRGETAFFAHGEDEGELFQVEQGKLEPEFIPHFHAGVVDMGFHGCSVAGAQVGEYTQNGLGAANIAWGNVSNRSSSRRWSQSSDIIRALKSRSPESLP